MEINTQGVTWSRGNLFKLPIPKSTAHVKFSFPWLRQQIKYMGCARGRWCFDLIGALPLLVTKGLFIDLSGWESVKILLYSFKTWKTPNGTWFLPIPCTNKKVNVIFAVKGIKLKQLEKQTWKIQARLDWDSNLTFAVTGRYALPKWATQANWESRRLCVRVIPDDELFLVLYKN